MNLQKKTLTRYKHHFPNETLRETSLRTGIQVTRVFRLFNGKTMKVKELEAFESAICIKIAGNPQYEKLNNLVEEASAILSIEDFEKISDYIARKMKCKELARIHFNSNFNNASIA